jgi:serine O-acetyltransferase
MLRHSITADYRMNVGANISLIRMIIAYFNVPGFRYLLKYRLAYYLYNRRSIFAKIIAKLIWNRLVTISGCYISLTARIAGGLKMPHPIGIVIGGGSVLKANITIYQNVTIGRSSQERSVLPIIGSGVIIYANSMILGETNIEKDKIIPAFSFIINNRFEKR